MQVVTPTVLEEFECQVCTEIMHPPIRMCILGHSFCDRCSKLVRGCPMCRQPKGRGRNYALEYIHDILILPCKYYAEGCSFDTLGANIQEHEKFCNQSINQCPLKPIDNCNWTGKLKDMVAHCRAKHPNNAFCKSEQKLVCSLFLGQIQSSSGQNRVGESYSLLFNAHEKLFKCEWDTDLQTGVVRFCVSLFGPRMEANNYFFQITFENEDGNFDKMELSSACQPMENPVFQEDKYIETHIHTLKKFCRKGHLYYTISIFKSNEEKEVSSEACASMEDDCRLPSNSVVTPQPSQFYDYSDPAVDGVRQLVLSIREDILG